MAQGVDTSLLIRPLQENDAELFGEFCCGDEEGDRDFADFLREDAWRLQALQIVSTYLALHSQHLVGYVSLLSDAVKLKSTERKSLRAGALRMRGDDHPFVPALKVARLAVSKDAQDGGLGTRLLRFALFTALDVSELAGCRLLTLDALPKRVDYYTRRGFVMNRDESHAAKERPSMRFDIFQPAPPPWASREG